MTREEFIGKLQMVYVGDKHASADIISEYDSMINLNNQLVEECQRLDDEDYYNGENKNVFDMQCLLYDLIKADLVEKIDK